MHPPATASIPRPSLALLGIEPWRAALEFASLKLMPPRVATSRGDGHRVIIFPGLAADARSVRPLRDHCRAHGYDAVDWGLGFNAGPHGDLDRWFDELATHVRTLLPGDDTVTLIGWSLGGLYAREVGKLLAPRIRQVITIGTPFNASADHTNVGWLFRLVNGSAPTIDPRLSARLRTPPPLPTTSIYSRSDGVVAWQTCCHDAAHAKGPAAVQDIEIDGSHVGMGWNPKALHIVGDRLAQRPGAWRPYVQG